MKGKLVLEDGSEFPGNLLNGSSELGEVVFNTGMTGYQETLTDPSYCGQIITMTYPLIGNYGTAQAFNQATHSYAKGFVIGQLCEHPGNYQAEETLPAYLNEQGIPCLYDVDTRAVTRKIRAGGAMKGVIVPADTDNARVKAILAGDVPSNVVTAVTTRQMYKIPGKGPSVVVMDFGIKQNIVNSLAKTGMNLTVVPAGTSAAAIMEMNPDGLFLSNGPGDPKALPGAIATIRELLDYRPIFGICLGHQLLALAMGGNTYKLPFGHRGSNHPVKDLMTGRVTITSQNHGYAVDEASIQGMDVTVTHRAVNDGTIEGMRHNRLPVFSVQYHPEAAPGPDDNVYLFDRFLENTKQ
ncbi:glutamine-hydrolyzing carbamoyl-phosphate synthase small subunit [Acetonema longum]|uniref:Carbamoyl phosphate synthase small chain n=1 Tax=Acetonema longum DSM 6540 TaxID=1009370 RepID=F7NDV9_9FIRM|nr:glutamine-hydrolyzing carbamoyl-phosphate synthase small subunit [Acetonema longum]EGO65774.1 carbamoyl-phosphate synthase, small subunit [Acetonema longum DSM 6540]